MSDYRTGSDSLGFAGYDDWLSTDPQDREEPARLWVKPEPCPWCGGDILATYPPTCNDCGFIPDQPAQQPEPPPEAAMDADLPY